MQVRLRVKFRPFNKNDERRDSGYYSGLDHENRASIDVNTNDDLFEQILTYYHEFTHNVIDLLFRRLRKRGVFEKEFALRDEWNKYIKKTDKEEELCRKVEKAVKKILKDDLPEKFFDAFFVEEIKKNKRKGKRKT